MTSQKCLFLLMWFRLTSSCACISPSCQRRSGKGGSPSFSVSSSSSTGEGGLMLPPLPLVVIEGEGRTAAQTEEEEEEPLRYEEELMLLRELPPLAAAEATVTGSPDWSSLRRTTRRGFR